MMHRGSFSYASLADHMADAGKEYGVCLYNGLPWMLYMAIHSEENLGALSQIQYEMVVSALLRGDEETAQEYFADFKGEIRFATVSKFIPGEHYHVLGSKFDEYGDAVKYANERGFRVDGLKEVFVYDVIGD